MKKIIVTCLLLTFLLVACAENEPMDADIFAMDTLMNIRIWGDEEALSAVVTKIHQLDSLLSAENESSDIYALNRNGKAIVSLDTAMLLAQAINLSAKTDGAFDPTVYPYVAAWQLTEETRTLPDPQEFIRYRDRIGMQNVFIQSNTVSVNEGVMLDLGGIGKGYAAQKCIELLINRGVETAILSLGGNVQTLGSKPDGAMWAVGIADPKDPSEAIAVVEFEGSMALVTSGSYQRYYEIDGVKYHHILDPETGYPVENGLASVTILTQSGVLADAYSTALFVMGLEKASAFWRQNEDFEAVFVTDDGTVYATEGAAPLLTNCNYTVIKR